MGEWFDFVVVGGGPAGAASAGLLAGLGLRVALCEQKEFPREKVCGEFLAPQARPILARLGVLEQFDALAGPEIRRLAMYAPLGPVVEGAMVGDAREGFPRALSRAVLDRLLLERAGQCGASVFQPCHVAGIEGSARKGFVIRTEQHGELRARLVVLAHGLGRGKLIGEQAETAKKAHDQQRDSWVCFKTRMSGCELADDAIVLASAAGLYAGLVRTWPETGAGGGKQGVCTLAFAVQRTRLSRLGPTGEAQFAGLMNANPAFRHIMKEARRVGPWMASGPLEPGLRTVYQDGRFAVGNAAGEVHTLVGEGMTLALKSAAHLADAIAAEGGGGGGMRLEGESIAARYTVAYERDFWPRYHAANVFAGVLTRPWLAGMAGAVLDEFPPLLAWCIRQSGKRPAAA